MSTVRQVGIRMVVDAQSVTTEVPRAAREFDALGVSAERASARTTRSLAQVQMSVRDIVAGAAGLHVVAGGFNAITEAILSMPRNAFDYSKQLEVSQVGMAGILGSMTAINGQQTQYNAALVISSDMIRRLNDDALRTAATSQELTTVFQALLAPGLSARMTLDEIRQLTVVGTNAVKSMGLESGQIVQELRDLVAGGITPASSTLATALGLKDSDIAAAKASSEGLFAFLMERMKGFEASSEAFGGTLKGKLDQVREGATRVAAEGLDPLVVASKQALTEVSALFVTIGEGGKVTLNQELIAGVREYATSAATALKTGMEWTGALWANRDAAYALGAVWASVKLGGMVADTVAATAAKVELANASRLAAAQAAVEAAGNVEVTATSAQKLAAYMAELRAKVASAEADVAAQAAQLATLATTREAIVVARAEVVAKLEATRATMAQAQAQIAAARAAGAQSFALALVREGTDALSAAQVRHAVLTAELATLGRQQAGVAASVAAAQAAQTAATQAATAAAGGLAAAQGAVSVAGRAMAGVLGFLGGPIGVLTTVLSLGAVAWSIWGDSASAAESRVSGDVERSTADIVADLNKQIAKLRERNALAAAGLPEVAKQNTAAAGRLAQLQAQIDNLQAGKGPSGGEPLPEAARVGLLQSLVRQYGELAGSIQALDEEEAKLKNGTGQLTLTLTGAEQAWRKVNDGVKTASAAQQEYDTKLSASRQAWETYKKGLQESGATAATIAARADEQAQVEAALARERDKKIKELGNGSASAQTDALDAQVAAVQQGYKLLAAQVADGLDAVDSLRKQDLIDEAEQLARRTALQLQGIDGQRKATQDELALMRGKKDSLKEQATLQGKLTELDQQRANVLTKATRDQAEADAKLLKGLDDQADAAQAAALQAQARVAVARAEAKEIGLVGAALGELRTARVDEAAKLLEAKALTMESIDLSGRTSEALRAQAQAMRDLAAVTDTTAAARAVNDFARAVEESAQAVEFEQRLALVSQRDRAIAIEQYRIAVDLKKRLADIDAKTTTDPALREKLRGEAEAAAAKAQVTAASRVNLAEWSKSVDQYNDIFRKGFGDMLARGESAWDAFTNSLANTFTTTVADQIYNAFAEPLVIDVVGNVLGVMGVGGTGRSGGTSALGTAANAASLYNAGSSVIGGGFGAVGGSLAASNVVGAVGGDALGSFIGANAANWGVSAAGSAMSQVMSVVFDPITLGIGALVAVLASLDDSGTPHIGGSAIADSVTGIKEIESALVGFSLSASDVSDKVVDSSKQLAGSALSILEGLEKLSGGSGRFSVSTGFADDSSKDGAWGSLAITRDGQSLVDWRDTQTNRWAPKEFANGEEGAKQYGNALAAGIKQAIDQIDLPDWAAKIVAQMGDSPTMDDLSATLAKIQAMPGQALQAIGTSSQALSGIIYTGMQAADPAGAGAAFAGQITYGIESSLYDGFSQQITGIISTQLVTPVVTAMASGATLTEAMATASVDAMKAQVAAAGAAFAAIVSDPGFQEALSSVNTLIADTVGSSVEGLTAPVAPAAYAGQATAAAAASTATTSLSNAVDQLRQKAESAVDSLKSTSADLGIELLRAQGNEKAALSKERQNYLAQYTDLAQAEQERITQLYDANQVIRDQIAYLERQTAIGEERKGLQAQLDELTLSRTELLAKERLTVDESNRDLFDRLNFLQEEQRIATERTGIEQQWLQTIGASAELRRRELSALDATNQALQSLVYRVTDLQTAAATANARIDTAYSDLQRSVDAEKQALAQRLEDDKKALAAQAEAAQNTVSSVKSIFDAIKSAIRSTTVETDALARAARDRSMSVLQGALAQARTGARVDSLPGVTDALSVLSKPSEQLYARFEDYARAQDAASDVMRQLGDQAGGQLSVAELTLRATKGAAEQLDDIYGQDVRALDETLEQWRTTIDIQNGIRTGVTLTIPQAIESLVTALTESKAATSAAQSAASLSAYSPTQVVGAVDYVRDAAKTGDVMSVYQGAVSAGLNVDQLTAVIALAGYNGIGTDDVRNWVSANGQAALPEAPRRFAFGGAFTGGGVVQRPTHFDIGQMAEEGPEAIMPLANINGRLGIRAQGAGSSPELVAAILAQNAILARIAAAVEAGAMHGYSAARAAQELVDRGVKVLPALKQPILTVVV